MFCKNCGKKIEDNTIFCGECGTQVENIEAENGETQSLNITPEINQCKRCNAFLDYDATFCGECGAAVNAIKNEAINDNAETQPILYDNIRYETGKPKNIKKKENLMPLIITLIVVLLLSASIICYFLFFNNTPVDVTVPNIESNSGKIEVKDVGSKENSAVPSPTPATTNYPAPNFEMATASNTTSITAANRNYDPYLIKDGRPDTAWNVSGGIGEWVMLSSTNDQKVSGIKILNGYTKYSTDYGIWVYYPNNRPREITISFSDGTSINRTLDDVFNESNYVYQDINFSEAKITKYIKITINSIYKGERWDDSCISEVQVY